MMMMLLYCKVYWMWIILRFYSVLHSCTCGISSLTHLSHLSFQKPVLVCSKAFSAFLHTHCPVVSERFRPTPWCWGGRLQTLVCAFLKSGPPTTYRKYDKPSLCPIDSSSLVLQNIIYSFIPQWTHPYSRRRPDFSGLGGQWAQRHPPRVVYPSHSVDPPRPDGEQPAVVCAPRHQPGHPPWLQVSSAFGAPNRKFFTRNSMRHILMHPVLWIGSRSVEFLFLISHLNKCHS